MARIGGRNSAMSWIAAVFCTGVVAALIWFAIPMFPTLEAFVGDALRSLFP
ncbi:MULTISPECIES: hypothetical protein [unclassified Microbacterium]|jgi:hypothetical protein|uniref:hypothetical protein n=1 Tax=unclassified Microbacterium TaxID=2609290 RepID=UPI00188E81FA|nr:MULTISPECIES: hypothetical protein [unclassified Microbacterium]